MGLVLLPELNVMSTFAEMSVGSLGIMRGKELPEYYGYLLYKVSTKYVIGLTRPMMWHVSDVLASCEVELIPSGTILNVEVTY